MKRFAVLFAVCAVATFLSCQDAMAQHCNHGGNRGNQSSFAIAVGGPNGAFSYGNGFYGRPAYGYGYGAPFAPVYGYGYGAPIVPVYGGGYPGYGGFGLGGGCRGGGGIAIGW